MQDIENLINWTMPSYLIVKELPKQGESNKHYVLDKEDCIEIYGWYEDGYRLLDVSIKERELVRCKDCGHGNKRKDGSIACSLYGYTDNGRYPDTPNVVMREDDFCSRAEERSQMDKVALQTMIDWAEKQKEVR